MIVGVSFHTLKSGCPSTFTCNQLTNRLTIVEQFQSISNLPTIVHVASNDKGHQIKPNRRNIFFDHIKGIRHLEKISENNSDMLHRFSTIHQWIRSDIQPKIFHKQKWGNYIYKIINLSNGMFCNDPFSTTLWLHFSFGSLTHKIKREKFKFSGNFRRQFRYAPSSGATNERSYSEVPRAAIFSRLIEFLCSSRS